MSDCYNCNGPFDTAHHMCTKCVTALKADRDEYERQAKLYAADIKNVMEQRDALKAQLVQAVQTELRCVLDFAAGEAKLYAVEDYIRERLSVVNRKQNGT